MKRLIVGVACLCLLAVSLAADAQMYIRQGGATTDWTCSLDNIGATLTECKAAPGAGKQLFLTDVIAQSTTTTAGNFLLRTGTGTNCGTGTVSLLPAAATVIRYAAPANTVVPLTIHLITPIPAPVNTAICLLGVGTNTVTATLSGFVVGF